VVTEVFRQKEQGDSGRFTSSMVDYLRLGGEKMKKSAALLMVLGMMLAFGSFASADTVDIISASDQPNDLFDGAWTHHSLTPDVSFAQLLILTLGNPGYSISVSNNGNWISLGQTNTDPYFSLYPHYTVFELPASVYDDVEVGLQVSANNTDCPVLLRSMLVTNLFSDDGITPITDYSILAYPHNISIDNRSFTGAPVPTYARYTRLVTGGSSSLNYFDELVAPLSSVPEPATIVLLLGGLVGLGALKKRK
jgi:hypothetical protein